MWRAINGRPPGPPIALLSAQRRKRLALSLRALDGHMDGASYRDIAVVLFGPRRISEQAWKTHPLRSRIIRLLKAGLALMRGGVTPAGLFGSGMKTSPLTPRDN
ncbi:DUF2285 domain-containing protein [Bradyrhizobium sp. CB1717]|uniref:DUF2285 domain-containing protein n=1 Tax=Bradyrhizobium sp. CB1717 TaxID=3039154 RepID=UPI0024B0DC70|nr:DUF2285 domain-containing protein [Bradyrhizobium sp. CB1717]WFU23205.1 DUF2285 domain-containing protein [Bradyrhizobium sp. CB1717]